VKQLSEVSFAMQEEKEASRLHCAAAEEGKGKEKKS
jgi:hypothetical protein